MQPNSNDAWARQCAAEPGRQWRVLARSEKGDFAAANEGEFDELVVDHWLHVERLDQRTWWMRVGDARVQIRIGEDGTTEVDVARGFYEVARGTTEESLDSDKTSEPR